MIARGHRQGPSKKKPNLLEHFHRTIEIVKGRLSPVAGYAALPAIWGIVFLQFLTGHRVIAYDSIEAYYPLAFFDAQSLRHGEWPWWNPYLYSGYPHVGDPQ